MYLDNIFGGRKERRLPIMVVVQLTPSDGVTSEAHERTYTDNFSAHGARVVSGRLWQPGEQAEIAPVNQEAPMRGEVVYCQKVEERFFVGFKFPDRLPWSILQRYDGW
jgi:hypothetical protein